MPEQMRAEIEGYLSILKECISLAESNNLSEGVIKGIQWVHDEIAKAKPLLKTEAHHKRLKADVEELLESLLQTCREGNERLCLGTMRQVRERVRFFKDIFLKKG